MRTYFLFDLQKWLIGFYVLNTEEIRKFDNFPAYEILLIKQWGQRTMDSNNSV